MNKFDGKKVLVIHNSTNAYYQEHLSAWIAKLSCDDVTYIDGANLNDNAGTHAVLDLVAAKTDNTYDYVLVTTAISDAGGSNVVRLNTLAEAFKKLKTTSYGDVIITDTLQAGTGVGTLVLNTGASTSNDTYNGCYVYTDGGVSGTAQVAYVYDYTGGGLSVDVGGADLTVDPAGDDYSVYEGTNIFVMQDPNLGVAAATYKYWVKSATATDSALVWDFIHSDEDDYKTSGTVNIPPVIVHNVSLWHNFIYSGTAAGAQTTTTLGDSGATWTTNAYAGMYVYIISGTGAGQYAQITSNSTTVLTCEDFSYIGKKTKGSTWATTPGAGSSVYRIVQGISEVFKDVLTQFGIKAVLYSLTDSWAAEVAQALLDDNGKIKDNDLYGAGEPPVQNLTYLGDFRDIEYGKKADMNKKDKATLFEIGAAIYIGTLKSIALT